MGKAQRPLRSCRHKPHPDSSLSIQTPLLLQPFSLYTGYALIPELDRARCGLLLDSFQNYLHCLLRCTSLTRFSRPPIPRLELTSLSFLLLHSQLLKTFHLFLDLKIASLATSLAATTHQRGIKLLRVLCNPNSKLTKCRGKK